MNKQTLVVFAAVVLVGFILIIVVPQLMHDPSPSNDNSGTTETAPPAVSKTRGPISDLNDKIDELAINSWDKGDYKFLEELIKQKYNAGSLSKAQEAAYQEALNLAYISTLWKATQRFFATASAPADLYPIYQELKRYDDGKQYKGNVATPYSEATSFYSLVNTERSATRYLGAGTFDEQQISNYLRDLKNASSRGAVAKSPLANRIRRETETKLLRHTAEAKIDPLQREISAYWQNQSYDEVTTNAYKRELDELERHPLLKDWPTTREFCAVTRRTLNEHLDVHESWEGLVNRLKYDCETACKQFMFYRNKCDSLQLSSEIE